MDEQELDEYRFIAISSPRSIFGEHIILAMTVFADALDPEWRLYTWPDNISSVSTAMAADGTVPSLF